MTYIAAALFFALVLMGSIAIIHSTVRDYWDEILAALRGDLPVRRTNRPWASRVRVVARPRPVVLRAVALQQRAAS